MYHQLVLCGQIFQIRKGTASAWTFGWMQHSDPVYYLTTPPCTSPPLIPPWPLSTLPATSPPATHPHHSFPVLPNLNPDDLSSLPQLVTSPATSPGPWTSPLVSHTRHSFPALSNPNPSNLAPPLCLPPPPTVQPHHGRRLLRRQPHCRPPTSR